MHATLSRSIVLQNILPSRGYFVILEGYFYMALTKKEVEHIALLARLKITDEEVEKFSHQLSQILEYVEQLQQVNTDGVELTAQVTGLENVLRDDVVDQCDGGTIKKTLALAPETEDDLIKARSVF